jgi:serine/threonine-protein kinase
MIASTSSVTMLRSDPRLAILPFTYRGPEEHAYLGDTFADELIDALCRTRGLAVLASGATAGYRDKRDPRVVGRELDVDAVVDGAVQSAGPRVRVSARLSDAKTGVQLASEKCEGEIADVFDLQDTLTRRVAEALRVSITTAAQGVAAPAEAVELYLRGRKQLRDFEYSGETGAVSLFGKALEMAPDLAPAAAAYAIACVRAWFIPGLEQGKDFGALARAAVARALEVAPALAETHFATALFASHEGDHMRMARELRTALRIAPAYADALEWLGMLEVETGRTARGVERIELAAGLDPTLTLGHIALARHHALEGDDARFFHYIDLLENGPHAGRLSVLQLLFRRAGWRRDLDAMRAVEARLPAGDGAPQHMAHLHADVVLGRASGASVVERVRKILAFDQSPRFRVFSGQLACEICGIAGEVEEGIAQLDVTSRMALVDLAWIERCPALDSLRSHPEFERARARVQKRVDEIWSE